MDPQKLIEDLEAAAAKARVTVDQLCRRAGINRATWQRIKAGKTKPSFRAFTSLQSLLAEVSEEAKQAEADNEAALMPRSRINQPANLKDLIRAGLKRAGMNQGDLALRLGISRVAVCQWCRGANGIKPERVLQVARLLSIPRADLCPDLYGDDGADRIPPAGLLAAQETGVLAAGEP